MLIGIKLKDFMTTEPAWCEPGTTLVEVGRLLIENDCGAIPVVDDPERRRPVGMITDRDITCRAVAEGRDALTLTAAGCMSSPCVTASLETTLEECCRLMEEKRIRRVVVIDNEGAPLRDRGAGRRGARGRAARDRGAGPPGFGTGVTRKKPPPLAGNPGT